jgi:GH24 family phage-related lysozyme (muramidase)
MRKREVDVFNYYDDGGSGNGHCTWGPGILAHRGPCTKEELNRPVSQASVDAEFARRVAKAEREVRSHVRKQALNPAQFDALVSLTYNAGARGSRGTYKLIEQGDLPGAGANIEDTVRYLREEAHASSWKLGLPEVVTVIDLSCTEALVKGYDKIVVLWKGFFFDAVRKDPGVGQQAKR